MSTYYYKDLPDSYRKKIKCADCKHLDRSDTKKDYHKNVYYRCKETDQYVNFNDTICSFVKTDSKIANSYGSFQPFGFYITTAIINIINNNGGKEHYHTDFVEYNIQKLFTKELANNFNCYELLEEYDMVAPKLAESLEYLPNNYEYATYLYNLYLLPVAIAVEQGLIEDALIMYIRLVKEVNNKFCGESLNMSDSIDYDLDNKIANDLQITLEEYYGEDMYVRKRIK